MWKFCRLITVQKHKFPRADKPASEEGTHSSSTSTCKKKTNSHIIWKLPTQTKVSRLQRLTDEKETQAAIKIRQQGANTHTNKIKTKEENSRTERDQQISTNMPGDIKAALKAAQGWLRPPSFTIVRAYNNKTTKPPTMEQQIQNKTTQQKKQTTSKHQKSPENHRRNGKTTPEKKVKINNTYLHQQ